MLPALHEACARGWRLAFEPFEFQIILAAIAVFTSTVMVYGDMQGPIRATDLNWSGLLQGGNYSLRKINVVIHNEGDHR